MRTICGVVLLFVLALAGWAQAPAGDGSPAPPAANQDPAAVTPQEPPAFRMPEAERRKFQQHLGDYIDPPGKKPRAEMLDKFQKYVGKPVDGHSLLEDVETITELAGAARGANPKSGRVRGRVVEEEIKPEVHGFPGGIGTVKYYLYLPKDYTPGKFWPVIYCLPDNQVWAEGSSYLEEVWLKRADGVANTHILVAPRPQAKGEAWTAPKSLARAMIALRHVCGSYDPDKKDAGPAVDIRRVFVDGDDAAAIVAARLAEMFAGAILRRCDGALEGSPNLRKVGGLAGLPAYCVIEKGSADQLQFAQRLKASNESCQIEEVDPGAALGDPAALTKWVLELPRPLQPRKIEYAIRDPSFQRHYWINVLEYDAATQPAPMFSATADRADNVVTIEPIGLARFELFLNDAIVDLNRKLRIVVVEGEKEIEFFSGKVERNLAVMLDELLASNHPWRVYPARFVVDLPALREVQAAREAAEAKKDEGKEAGGGAGQGKPSGGE
ncbi:MAG: hypothetical protein ACREID_08900 [Planctomycetota bacterium]